VEHPSENPSFPCLVGLVGAAEGRRLALAGPRLVLGRDASRCQLVLEHALVSREHAAFEIDGDGQVVVIDLASKQGTFVNGKQVNRHELRHGDSVGFGLGGMLAFRFEGAPVDKGRTDLTTPIAFSVAEIRSQLRAAGTAAAHSTQTKEARVLFRTPVAAAVAVDVLPDTVRIGRSPDNEVVLDSPAVSRFHSRIRYVSEGLPVIEDAGSTNGTFVNGENVRTARPVSPTDLISVGGYLLRVNGRNIAKHDLGSSRIVAAGITKKFDQRVVVDDVSFAIFPREFVGLMGPSGCGKSTLMDALNGIRPATNGTVFIDELNLYENFDAVRRSIGYVPQRDVLHDALTVERTLHYAARLRLPEGTSPTEMARVVEETLATVGLLEHRSTEFRQLSGGQQKRLSLALELLTKPSFLFLDEPTSPLDPETSEQLMLLFRRLADEGRIVVMVTHKFERFEQMHQIALLTKGGRLAFFGPPTQALTYFGCGEPSQIYRRMAQKEPEEVANSFRASPQYREYVTGRLDASKEAVALARAARGAKSQTARNRQRAGFRQFQILAARYLELKVRDRRNTILLIAQAPIIAAIVALIAGDTVNDGKTLFVAAIIAIWFGANNAVREVVAEISIYQRERLVNLKIPSYLLSKFTVLAGFAIIQCSLLLITLSALGRLRWTEFAPLLATLSLTALSGIAMGLMFSTIVNTAEKAMSLLPLILIPQLLLSGFMKPIDDVYFQVRTGKPATAEQYRAFQSAQTQGARRAATTEPVAVIDGLGPGSYVSAFMGARWSLDALVHVVGATDAHARERLASQLTVVANKEVQNGTSEEAARSAFRSRAVFCWVVLVFSTVMMLAAAGVVLRSKDSL
jgi:ABC-type multidrug transport system ATPase subunit